MPRTGVSILVALPLRTVGRGVGRADSRPTRTKEQVETLLDHGALRQSAGYALRPPSAGLCLGLNELRQETSRADRFLGNKLQSLAHQVSGTLSMLPKGQLRALLVRPR